MKASLATILALLSIATGAFISEECQIQKNNIKCKCAGNQEFYLPDEYIYENTTSFSLSTCSNARLLYPGLFQATNLSEFIIENISDQLSLELMLSAKNFSRFELTNIKKIPQIEADLLISLKKIEHLTLSNIFINDFKEHFTETGVVNLTMVNVTMNRLEGFNFKEGGENLKIINCEFRNITKSLNFHFTNVTIINSRFEMQKPEYFHVNSDYAFVENNVFHNVLMELVGSKKITINNTCAGGQSTVRLSSFDITSFNNKWPTDIVNWPNKQSELKVPSRGNNIVCKAGNCQCPKSNGQNGNRAIAATFVLEIFFIWLTYVMSRL